MLTDKQQKAFVDWYLERYYPNKGEGLEKPLPLPHVHVEKKQEEIEAWKERLTKIIWPKKAKQTYKIRPYWKETILHKVFSSLWLCYAPIFDGETWEDVDKDVFSF